MRRGPRCSIAEMLDQLKDTDAKAVRAALDGSVGAVELSAVLRAHGFRIMSQTIRRHRRDDCSCSTPSTADFAEAGSIEGALALLNNGGRA